MSILWAKYGHYRMHMYKIRQLSKTLALTKFSCCIFCTPRLHGHAPYGFCRIRYYCKSLVVCIRLAELVLTVDLSFEFDAPQVVK